MKEQSVPVNRAYSGISICSGRATVHQDPYSKGQRITNTSGNVVSTVELDPWGGDTSRSSNQAFQPHRFTTYERDANGGDDAMMRRYQGTQRRFAQPDPFDGSFNTADPQSFNRYTYTQNHPVNLVDPSGLNLEGICIRYHYSNGAGVGFWGEWTCYGGGGD